MFVFSEIRLKILGSSIGDKPLSPDEMVDADNDGKCRERGGKWVPCPPGVDAGTSLFSLRPGVRVRQPGIKATKQGDTSGHQEFEKLTEDQKKAVIASFHKNIPYTKKVTKKGKTVDEQARLLVDWMTKNADRLAVELGFVKDGKLTEKAKVARRWYDVANKFNKSVADEIGVDEKAVHAVTAIFSAATDWRVNVPLSVHASKMMKKNDIITEEHSALIFSDRINTLLSISQDKDKTEETRQKALEQIDAMRKLGASAWAKQNGLEVGKRLREQNPVIGGRILKATEKAGLNGGPLRSIGFEVNKDGTYSVNYMNALAMSARNPEEEHAKAFRVLREAFDGGGDQESLMKVISDNLGDGAKVRSFYNNMADPNDTKFGSVTIDTHQAGLLLGAPVPNNDPFIKSGVFTKTASIGTPAMYLLMKMSTSEWAQEYGLLNREGQSVLWEAQRLAWNLNKAKKKQALSQIKKLMENDSMTEQELLDMTWKIHKELYAGVEQADSVKYSGDVTGFLPKDISVK